MVASEIATYFKVVSIPVKQPIEKPFGYIVGINVTLMYISYQELLVLKLQKVLALFF